MKRINLSLNHPDVKEIIARLTQWPLSAEVCSRLTDLDFDSDPADELIAATSLAYNVPLLTRDKKIRASKVVPLAL